MKVPLTKGFFAVISAEDAERVLSHKWHASIESRNTKVYACRKAKKGEPEFVPGKRTKIRMHRWILGLNCRPDPNDPVVDHINGDSLDNRRENLQLITQAENMERAEFWKKKGIIYRVVDDPEDWL